MLFDRFGQTQKLCKYRTILKSHLNRPAESMIIQHLPIAFRCCMFSDIHTEIMYTNDVYIP